MNHSRSTARGTICALALCVCLVPALPATGPGGGPPEGAAPGSGYRPDEILIELREPASRQARARVGSAREVAGARTGVASLDILAARYAVREMRALLEPAGRFGPSGGDGSRLSRVYHIRLAHGSDLFEALDAYRADPSVAAAQLNYLYAPDLAPSDPLYSSQYAHQVTSAEGGWDVETGNSSIIIAVVGTGVELTHPDLVNKLVPGWDFSDNDADPSPAGDPHETQVAGVAAASTSNGIGVAGVCWGCGIMPLRIDYTTVQVAQAVSFAVVNGARVVNMSFGNYDPNKYGPDTVVETAIDDGFAAGVVMVATAGNDAVSTMRFPGALDNVIGVAATTSSDQRAGFSNYGSWVDVAAPGQSIVTTTVGGGYTSVNGTSFSAPYVSGLAGLLLSADPARTPATVRLIIEYTVDRITVDHFIGSGRVNVARALYQSGVPSLFAVIKSPLANDLVLPGILSIQGTALGDGYSLEHKPASSGSWTVIGSGTATVNGELGTLDATPLGTGPQDLRLTSWSGGAYVQDQIAFYRSSTYQTGWPIATSGAVVSSPTLADLNGDGHPEVIVGDNSGKVYAWRSNGTLMNGWPVTVYGPYVLSSPAVGDLDGDGDPEIVVTNYASAYVFAYHHTGVPVAGFPRNLAASSTDRIRGSVALVDLDGQPGLEMVAATIEGYVHVLKAPGAVEAPGWPVYAEFNVQTTPAIGDIDHDDQMEIIIRQWKKIFAFNADGSPVGGWPLSSPGSHTSPVLGDLDGDGTLEIVDAGESSVAAYGGDASVRFSVATSGVFTYSGMSLGDVDGDAKLEIFLGEDGGRVFGLRSNGTLLPGWPAATGDDVVGAPIIADIDGDGFKDILAGSTDRLVHVWDAGGTAPMDPLGIGGLVYSSPAVGDLDGDGDLELVVGSEDGRVHAFDLQAAWDPALADWPKFQGDASNTGHYRFAEAYRDSDGDGEVDLFDCEPLDAAVHHGAVELCNGTDDDCSGVIDDPFDLDRDGHTTCGDDCDDTRFSVYPGAPQVCGDGLNNDCSDPGWPSLAGTNESDDDTDGFSECGGDCDDGNDLLHPGAVETCDNIDNDCNGIVDDPFDADFDGFSTCEADCDDTRATVYPGALQICDGLNNDCDDAAWPVPPANEMDGDLDNLRICDGDCDDTRPTVYPNATQICNDGLNNDCLAPGWPSLTGTNEADDDGDMVTECGGDCDDGNAQIRPGAIDICDGIDNDCSGRADELFDTDADGVPTCLGDCDDTHATVYPGAPQICDTLNNDCDDPGWPTPGPDEADSDQDGYSVCMGDCDDSRLSVWPGAPQICGDGLNNNCLDARWPDPSYADADSDGDGRRNCAEGGAPPDCNDNDPRNWATPSEVVRIGLAGPQDIFMEAPPTWPGSSTALHYEWIRSADPSDFGTTAICLDASDGNGAFVTDFDPAPGFAYHYLARARNGCPFGSAVGPLGSASDGTPTTGRSCP